ncbi:MAG TPA: hypothetical protein VG733_08880, partial [Chthoniobacteraceae bacterium]|nr:hypothetical protein [Chthoniobacteraceae bacterium]
MGLIASTFSATATNHSAGQEKSTAPGTRQVVEQAFASIENVLAQCKSVDFQSTHQVTETEIFRQIYSKYARSMKMTGGRTSELHFVARDDKYWYSSVITEFDGSSNYDEERAFDGKNYQLLYRKLGTLGFSRFNPEGNHLDIGSLNPLEMFGFLLPQVQGSMPCIAWSAVKNARMWGNCLAAAQYVEVTVYNGRACMT